MEEFKGVVSNWNMKVFGNILWRKQWCLARLNSVQKQMQIRASNFLMTLERVLIEEYNIILKQEELYWNKKARVKWLVDGERNTHYFHTLANQTN